MLGLDLTFGQKLQLAFVLLMFSIAGYLIFSNNRQTLDMTVTSWTQQHLVGIDPSKPPSTSNPVDTAKSSVLTIFACHDGHLEITEFPDDADTKPIILFRPDLRRTSYDIYRTTTERLNAIKDPYKRTLTTAAYWFADGRVGLGASVIARSGLDREQAKTEKELQRDLLDQVDRIRQGAKTGSYLPELYDNVLRALAEYRAREGDPTKDPAKAALAHKVLDFAAKFLNQQQKDEGKLVDKYISGMDTLLTAEQKAKLAETAKLVTAPRPPRSGRNRAAG
ncbi:MAG: hypothetical protein FWD61_07000 [Phycisphaerales bacterium]|nr:hypothetical protein [Phycisphaerales bacterium]